MTASHSPAAPGSRLQTYATCAALAVSGLGIAVLAGWILDLRTLKSVVPGLVAMNPATALAFVLAGSSLWLSTRRSHDRPVRALAAACGAAVALIAVSRILTYLGALDVGVDRWLFRRALEAESVPNRMAPNTAFAFLLTGLALLGLGARRRWACLATQLLALTAIILSLTVLCGYAYRAGSLVQIRDFIPMALHTAFGFAILGSGIFCARSRVGLLEELTAEATGGRVARALLPAAIGIPPVLGWVRVQGEHAGLYTSEAGAALLVVAWALVLSALVWWQARVLNRADAAQRAANARINQLNEDLRRRAAEIEATNRELEAFSYSVSHDLRAPLRSVTSFSQALLEDCAPQLDEHGRDYLDRVVRAGRRMSDLIDDLLALSRITRKELEREAVDLASAAREVAERLAEQQPDRHVDVRIEPGLFAHGDLKLIKILLENLVGNAWKFTSRQPSARIELGTLAGQNGNQVFYVRDNGAGFNMEYAERLFAPFQRLHGEVEFPGTGIGLATVQRIVGRHGGRVWAEGAVSRGATFYFTL